MAFCALLLPRLLLAAESPNASPEGIEFFEKKIRPVLVERCYACHSAENEKKLKANLYLDSREGLLKGGDTGPSIVLGAPEKSLLIKAITYKDDNLMMPPKGKLTPEQIKDFESWVRMGAPDPRLKAKLAGGADTKKWQSHWAFQMPKESAAPKVADAEWTKNPIDAFVLAKLQEKKMTPAAQADKRTLVRRATFDLTGLPPTAEEVAAFEADTSPEAFAKVVDRLLTSPRYGERWGRYWLDVARYADTKGYVFEEERRYPYSYTYRDWVIRSFNEDLPYDQFLINQIAADRVVKGDDKRALAAMGFLTLGRRFLNQQPDIIDDRIDVVTRGTMGLTVGCARCHDHKFDPIPTKDYYSLYGVFSSSSEPKNPPVINPDPVKSQATLDYEKDVAGLDAQLKTYRATKLAELVPPLRKADKIAAYLLAAYDLRGKPDEETKGVAEKRDLNRTVLQRWRNLIKDSNKDTHPIFAPLHAFNAIPEAEFAIKAQGVMGGFVSPGGETPPSNGQKRINTLVGQAFEKTPANLKEVLQRYADLVVANDKAEKLADANAEALRQVLRGENSPTYFTDKNLDELLNRKHQDEMREIRKKIDALHVTHAGAPPRANIMEDNEKPTNPRVFMRGDPNKPGDEVPRQFLSVLAGEKRQPFKNGSGRLELAQAIASKDNPLTARVYVNRVWQNHFGAGLVRTPSDFGVRTELPTHPELLDNLAVKFVNEGWSTKKLHRWIMLSKTYQQSSELSAAAMQGGYGKTDPENMYLWHMPRRRLDFEALRDSVISVAGNLDLTMGGRPVELTADPFPKRRTVYGNIERQNLPGMFRTFDFASPDTHSPQRYFTTVPQQALFMMNSPFVIENAKSVAKKTAAKDAPLEQRIEQLYALIYSRKPTADELAIGKKFLGASTEPKAEEVAVKPQSAWQYGYGQYDEGTKRVQKFKPMAQYVGESWQMGPKLPDPTYEWLLLNKAGGHPGGSTARAAIRRWIAPRDGVITVNGKLSHGSKEGDGVLGRIVSSTIGHLKDYPVHATSADTTLPRVDVKKGDTIDFIVECRTNHGFDSFEWALEIEMIEPAAKGQLTLWNATADFSGQQIAAPKTAQLSPWERYAQVLMLSNEFVFVD